MATLERTDAVRRAESYGHAVLSWVDDDGYPTTVAGAFTTEPEAASVTIGPIDATTRPPDGRDVCVTFSHIRPQPGMGYDERRYVNLWGRATATGDGVRVVADRAAGWDEAEIPFFEYAERSVPAAHDYLDDVHARPRLSRWWTFFLATRLPFLTATVVPIALGGAVAGYDGGFSWGWWLLALLAGCAVHLGLNIANDIFDDANGADAANTTPTPFSGGSRVIQYGLVTRRQMIGMCVGFYTFAVAVGLVLAATRGWELLAVGAFGIVLSLVYSMPPIALVHRGLGEPVTALGFGPVMAAGAYVSANATWSWDVVYASLPVAILVALILYVNEIPDRVGDEKVGKRTLPVRWPKSRVIGAYTTAVVVAFLLVPLGVVLGIMPAWTLLMLAAAPLAAKVRTGLLGAYDSPYALMPAMQHNIALHLAAGLLLVAGYLLAIIL